MTLRERHKEIRRERYLERKRERERERKERDIERMSEFEYFVQPVMRPLHTCLEWNVYLRARAQIFTF